MSSKRRIESSRRNGARSRGPKTEAGKCRSSQNATRHGLLAERVVLEDESQENFQIVVNDYVQKFQPRDGVEFGMIEEMSASYWRLHRAMAIEQNLFNEAMERNPDGAGITRLGRAWNELADAPSLHTLIRYQSMLHRMHWRSMKNLFELRDLGPQNPELPNEPSPKTGHSRTRPPATPLAAAERQPAAVPPVPQPELIARTAIDPAPPDTTAGSSSNWLAALCALLMLSAIPAILTSGVRLAIALMSAAVMASTATVAGMLAEGRTILPGLKHSRRSPRAAKHPKMCEISHDFPLQKVTEPRTPSLLEDSKLGFLRPLDAHAPGVIAYQNE